MFARALYGSNVFHYRHVYAAMSEVARDVGLVRRFEVDTEVVARMARLGVPKTVLSALSRRAVDPVTGPQVSGLGLSGIVRPALARSRVISDMQTIRAVTKMQARLVNKRAGEVDFLQFMEGMGHRALEQKSFELSICERRNLHHSVFERDPGVLDGFPFEPHSDPIGDLLDFEYDASDYVAVYSGAAKQSFVDEGFPTSKVLVTPLGVEPITESKPIAPAQARDPHLIAYVGRADAHKGLDVACATVKLLGPPFRLAVAGPAQIPVESWLRRWDFVDYRGVLDKSGLDHLYSTAAALLNPSIESFGYAAVEGAAAGCRLVCATTTGAAEFLPATSRIEVAGRNPGDFAEAVLQAIDSMDPFTVGQDARAALTHMSWERAAKDLANTYRSLPEVASS